MKKQSVSRRDFFRRGAGALALGAAGTAALLSEGDDKAAACSQCKDGLGKNPVSEPYVLVGKPIHDERVVRLKRPFEPPIPKPLDPTTYLTHFDYGKVTKLPDGRTVREYTMVAVDQEIDVAPGVSFPAWTFNGSVPGPTIRCTEGDLVRVHFFNNSLRDHTIHR